MPDNAVLAAQIEHSNYNPTLSVKIPAKGPSNRATGYGNHFVELVLGMLRLGADVSVYPYFCEPPLPPEFLACLMGPWDFEATVGLMMANPMRLERTAEHTIGITTWETTKLPPDDVRRSLSAVDELIVPCEDNIAMFAELAPNKPCHYVPEGVDHEFFSYHERDWLATPLKIGMFGALTYRKGIDLALEAFVKAFDSDPRVELHIATTFFDLPQFKHIPDAVPNVFVEYYGWFSREKVRDWMWDKHALFAPYRGEGYYQPGAEFKATGGITIMPNLMGTKSYNTPSNGIIIPAHYETVKHWGEFHGEPAARYGEWLAYEEQDIIDALTTFVEMPPQDKRALSSRASGEMPLYANWDYAAQRTIDIFVDAYRAAA